MLYVANYNELQQLCMQVLLNCHGLYKKWPNDNLIICACVIALVHYC